MHWYSFSLVCVLICLLRYYLILSQWVHWYDLFPAFYCFYTVWLLICSIRLDLLKKLTPHWEHWHNFPECDFSYMFFRSIIIFKTFIMLATLKCAMLHSDNFSITHLKKNNCQNNYINMVSLHCEPFDVFQDYCS